MHKLYTTFLVTEETLLEDNVVVTTNSGTKYVLPVITFDVTDDLKFKLNDIIDNIINALEKEKEILCQHPM